jgi:hypothetical protein
MCIAQPLPKPTIAVSALQTNRRHGKRNWVRTYRIGALIGAVIELA